jgi:MFS family permease
MTGSSTHMDPGAGRANSSGSSRALPVVVATVCFLMGFTGRGLLESFVVFLLPLSTEFSLDRASAVSIYALSVLAAGTAGPLVGRLFDRAGPRAVYTTGLALIGVGLWLASLATRLWHLQVSIGLGVGLGAACLGNVSNASLVARWFRTRLTLVTSIVFSSLGIGILVVVPTTQVAIDALGWRSAYHWMGTLTLALLIPLSLLPWRTFAAGSREVVQAHESAASKSRAWTIREAAGETAFWGLFAVYFFTSMAMFAIMVQVVAYLVEVGFPPLQAATAWGFSGILLPAGMIIVGWLDGLIGRRRSIILSYAISLVGIGALWLLAYAPSVWMLGMFIVCFGGMLGSRGPLISTIALRTFRGPQSTTIFGMITIGSGVGSALGAWLGGFLHDLTGSYEPVMAFAILGIACAVVPFFTITVLRSSKE